MLILTKIYIICILALSHPDARSDSYTNSIRELPVLPNYNDIQPLKHNFHNMSFQCKRFTIIPCTLWLTIKNASTMAKSYSWVAQLISKNPDWQVRIVDDSEVNRFMDVVFNGTKLLWAFNMINPSLGVARADIWRYAVLWVYGGGYLDTDSNIVSPLREVVQKNDSFIFSWEGVDRFPCYNETFHLYRKLSTNHSTRIIPSLPDKKFLQWLFFSEAKHSFLKQTLENIVEIIELEYYRKSVLLPNLPIVHEILCVTGPDLFTHSIIEVIQRLQMNVSYRTCNKEWRFFKGHAKMIRNKNVPGHYSKYKYTRQIKPIHVLREYYNGSKSNITVSFCLNAADHSSNNANNRQKLLNATILVTNKQKRDTGFSTQTCIYTNSLCEPSPVVEQLSRLLRNKQRGLLAIQKNFFYIG
eukprot:gene3231-6393_t